jgi:hypothetical protein
MAFPPDPEHAVFTPQSGPASGQAITVHFNPEKLQIDITNTLEDKGSGKDKKQYVSKSSAKLAMELVFDSTDDGSDVRLQTGKIAKLMEPGKQQGNQGSPPSIVLFEWGAFKFQGMIDSYKESLEFFSSNGVPLRATVSLSMANQDKVFEALTSGDENRKAEPLVQNLSASGESVTALASRAGNPAAGRALAAANGLESMRRATGAIAVDASISLAPPLAFAAAGLSVQGTAGGSAGLSAGVGAGMNVGVSAGVAAGGTTGVSSGGEAGVAAGRSAQGSAGVSLRVDVAGSAPVSQRLDLERLRRSMPEPLAVNGSSASFQVGGMAASRAPSGLQADVGATKSLQGRLQFN